MTLDAARIGSTYEIVELKIEGITGRRLEALGLIPGTWIEVLNRKKYGAVIFRVRGTRIAIGKKIAQFILVREE